MRDELVAIYEVVLKQKLTIGKLERGEYTSVSTTQNESTSASSTYKDKYPE